MADCSCLLGNRRTKRRESREIFFSQCVELAFIKCRERVLPMHAMVCIGSANADASKDVIISEYSGGTTTE
jgi:hypothetical protein